ncbi:MAG: hypothetical protein S4CHLAM37_02510 [Chlamydiia bacterium]|nr:hypothetical protein [Chlamydiia bacterium]
MASTGTNVAVPQRSYIGSVYRYAESTARTTLVFLRRPVIVLSESLGIISAEKTDKLNKTYVDKFIGERESSVSGRSAAALADVIKVVAHAIIMTVGAFIVSGTATPLQLVAGFSLILYACYSFTVNFALPRIQTQSDLAKCDEQKRVTMELHAELLELSEAELKQKFKDICGRSFERVFDTEAKRKELKLLTGAKTEGHGVARALSHVIPLKEIYEKKSEELNRYDAELNTYEVDFSTPSGSYLYNLKGDELLKAKVQFAHALIPLLNPEIPHEALFNIFYLSDLYPLTMCEDMFSDSESSYISKNGASLLEKESPEGGFRFIHRGDFLSPKQVYQMRPKELALKFISWRS